MPLPSLLQRMLLLFCVLIGVRSLHSPTAVAVKYPSASMNLFFPGSSVKDKSITYERKSKIRGSLQLSVDVDSDGKGALQELNSLPLDSGKTVFYSESTLRSLTKAVIWRITAAIITLLSGLIFSKNIKTAASIVTSDFVTKSGFMFLGERVWNKVSWGKGKKTDGAKRSLAKALLWRVFAAGNTLLCGTFLAKDVRVALKIAGSDTLVKTVLFFLNERIWARVEWGKQYSIEYVI